MGVVPPVPSATLAPPSPVVAPATPRPAAAIAPLGADRDPALVTPGATVTHGDLRTRIASTAARLEGPRRLALIPARNDVATLVAYLGAMAAGHPVLLVPAEDPSVAPAVTDRFAPSLVFSATGGAEEEADWLIHDGGDVDLHPDLALLLTTSGTTGSPKLVRLSHDNLRANATAIVEYLGITPDDVALATLPVHYSYGLSVLHSHLWQARLSHSPEPAWSIRVAGTSRSTPVSPLSPGFRTPSHCSTGATRRPISRPPFGPSPRPADGWHPTTYGGGHGSDRSAVSSSW